MIALMQKEQEKTYLTTYISYFIKEKDQFHYALYQ